MQSRSPPPQVPGQLWSPNFDNLALTPSFNMQEGDGMRAM